MSWKSKVYHISNGYGRNLTKAETDYYFNIYLYICYVQVEILYKLQLVQSVCTSCNSHKIGCTSCN